MEKSSRSAALLAYLIPLIVPIFILLFSRKHLLATYHACQSLAIFIGMLLAPVVWVVLSWPLTWIPWIGPILFASLFALVIATWIFALFTLILGIFNALKGEFRRVPVFGRWGETAFLRLYPAEEIVTLQDGQEAAV